MFNQIISEIEDELGVTFGPTVYCPNTFSPTRSIFRHKGTTHHIFNELINIPTWTTFMSANSRYMYDVCIKTTIKNCVIKTMVKNYCINYFSVDNLKDISDKLHIDIEDLLHQYHPYHPGQIDLRDIPGFYHPLVKFKIKKHTLHG